MENPSLSLWKSLLINPLFKDIPFKVETTKGGSILMSPASNWHGICQSQVGFGIRNGIRGGEIINECSILTPDGVKVADVAWASDEFIDRYGYKTPYLVAPEICVEVVSPGNTQTEIDNKINLYLAKGAIEVWIVSEEGRISFFDKAGSAKKSKLSKPVKITKRI